MNAQILSSSKQELSLSIKESDIATLYIIQNELLKDSNIDFAGVIVKHPLTNELWMRISSKSNPLQEITKASETAIKTAEDIKKLLQDGTVMLDNWTDNKLEKLLEDIQNLPSDEEEMLALFRQILHLEGEIFDAMNVQNYEKFFYIKVGVEKMLEDIKSALTNANDDNA